jgi:hypothetical protein
MVTPPLPPTAASLHFTSFISSPYNYLQRGDHVVTIHFLALQLVAIDPALMYLTSEFVVCIEGESQDTEASLDGCACTRCSRDGVGLVPSKLIPACISKLVEGVEQLPNDSRSSTSKEREPP